MKRMLYILEILKKEKFVLTHIKMVRYIQKRDADEGYPFRVLIFFFLLIKQIFFFLFRLIKNLLANVY